MKITEKNCHHYDSFVAANFRTLEIGSKASVRGSAGFFGRVEYFTPDGWVGIRQGKEINEAPLSHVNRH